MEEWIVRDFFEDKRNGTFVDIGSAHHRDGNNTWFLETQRGWSGLAVDPQERYAAAYAAQRPATRFFPLFISDRSNERARLFIIESAPDVASSESDFTAGYGDINNSVEVPTLTLDALLQSQKIQRVDFLSIDVELSEPKVLAGFDIGRYAPGLICIEAHPQVRQSILDYFADNRYVVVGKYLRVDQVNLWFMPRGTVLKPFPISSS
jgi:FkbM family methyltransferase